MSFVISSRFFLFSSYQSNRRGWLGVIILLCRIIFLRNPLISHLIHELMTGIFIIASIAVVASYLIFLVWTASKIQRKCECRSCHTSIHIERTNRPDMVKKLAGFVALKYYRCRHCSNTFFLFESTPDNEPVKMTVKKRRSPREASVA